MSKSTSTQQVREKFRLARPQRPGTRQMTTSGGTRLSSPRTRVPDRSAIEAALESSAALEQALEVLRQARDHELMTVNEVAEYLRVPTATIYAWRKHGAGPDGFKVGRHKIFRRADIDAWLETRKS